MTGAGTAGCNSAATDHSQGDPAGEAAGARPLPRRALYTRRDLAPLLAPASVAVIGASPRPGSFGDRVLHNLSGYTGRIHLVNAKYPEVNGRPCHPSLRALPEVPNCAVIAAGREAVEALVTECAGAGIGAAIVFASGYAETGKPERAALQQRLAAIARDRNIRLVGPNCIGIAISAIGAGMTFSGMPKLVPPRAHAIGIVSQSGALGFALGQGIERGVAVSHILTSGNSADVDMADYVAALAEEPGCRAIACLFEGMAEPMRLVAAAERAWQADKPLVVCKLATGAEGARAAMSHTGSLAGPAEAWRAALARAGAVMVEEPEALVQTAAFFAKAPPPRARGVAVAATSGGAAIMAADQAEKHGVPLPQPGEATRAVLEARIPEFGSPRNPCDVTGQVLTDPDSMRACAGALLADSQFGALVTPHAYAYDTATRRLPVLSELARAHGKIVCNVWVTEWLGGPGARETEEDPHLALFHSMDCCFAALAAWHERAARRGAPERGAARLSPEAARERAAALIRAAPDRVLTEREAKAVLAEYGVPVIPERLATEVEEAVGAAASLGYPVALKIESPDIPHKSDAGALRLNLRGADEVREAFSGIVARADAIEPPPRVNGVLVQPMAPRGVEVMAGARIDAQFGPLLLLGLGGALVELLKDTALLPAPAAPGEVIAALRSLRGFAALDGFRGAEPADLGALADALCRISELAADQTGLIAEMDVNPLICAGPRIVAVDALIVRRAAAVDPLAELGPPEIPGGGLG